MLFQTNDVRIPFGLRRRCAGSKEIGSRNQQQDTSFLPGTEHCTGEFHAIEVIDAISLEQRTFEEAGCVCMARVSFHPSCESRVRLSGVPQFSFQPRLSP
jgi:hypothetical protein